MGFPGGGKDQGSKGASPTKSLPLPLSSVSEERGIFLDEVNQE